MPRDSAPPPRPLRRDGLPRMERLGVPREAWRDAYFYVLVQPWGVFFAILIGLYLCANCIFAALYLLQPASIDGARTWPDAFFFSLETMATVGYGVMHPATFYAHMLVSAEILFGVLAVPVATGLTILKFARPTARVLFSRNAVVAPFDGVPTLMFRAANIRSNTIVEARVKVTMLRVETTAEGHTLRRLVDLPLVRDTNPSFALSWVILHPISEESPLFGMTGEACLERDVQIVAVMTGLDATSSTTVHARYAYDASDLRFGQVFADIITTLPDGSLRIDYRRFHDLRPVASVPSCAS